MSRLAPALILAAALAAGEEPQPQHPPQTTVTPTAAPALAPSLAMSAKGGMSLSMSADKPSEAMGGVTIRYEEVRLEGDRLTYRLSPYPGAAKPVLFSADILGGPAGPADGHVLLDSTASKLPQIAFHGVMRPAKVEIRRQDPDPAHPGEVLYLAELSDLGDLHGLLRTEKGERQHIAWADRAVLKYVATLDPRAGMGLGAPRLTDIFLYGRPATATEPAKPAVVMRMIRPVPDAEATVAQQLAGKAYGMRAGGRAIAMSFDAEGKLAGITGIDDYEMLDGEDLVPMQKAQVPKVQGNPKAK